MPKRASALETGQAKGNFTRAGKAAAVAPVQSRCEGELKSPTRKVGVPARPSRASGRSQGRISGSRTERSSASTFLGPCPSRAASGP